MHQPSRRAQATRNYRQQLGVGLFSNGNPNSSKHHHPTLASLGSQKHHPNRATLKSISDMHLKSLTASNVSLKFKNKFSESRKRNNYMTSAGPARRDSAGRDVYHEGSDGDPRMSSNERQIYNTFSSNYINAHRTFGASASLLNQQVNMTKMMMMSQKKARGPITTKTKMPASTKNSVQMKPYYHTQNSGGKVIAHKTTISHHNVSTSPKKMNSTINRTM